MSDEIRGLLLSEEAKRNAGWTSSERRRVLLDTLNWAEAQRTVRRNTPAACRADEERKLLANFVESVQCSVFSVQDGESSAFPEH